MPRLWLSLAHESSRAEQLALREYSEHEIFRGIGGEAAPNLVTAELEMILDGRAERLRVALEGLQAELPPGIRVVIGEKADFDGSHAVEKQFPRLGLNHPDKRKGGVRRGPRSSSLGLAK